MSVRVCFRLPERLVKELCKAYPEASSVHECIKRFLLEVLTGRIEQRNLQPELFEIAEQLYVEKGV